MPNFFQSLACNHLPKPGDIYMSAGLAPPVSNIQALVPCLYVLCIGTYCVRPSAFVHIWRRFVFPGDADVKDRYVYIYP